MRAFAVVTLAALLWAPRVPAQPALFRVIESSTDVAWLERLCTDVNFAEAEYRVRGANTSGVEGNRSRAYIRLGALGSPESLAAVNRIERAALGRSVLAPAATPGTPFYDPAPHMSDSRWTFMSQIGLRDGREAAALILNLYGPRYLYIATRAAGQWTPPRMVPVPILSEHAVVLSELHCSSMDCRAPCSIGKAGAASESREGREQDGRRGDRRDYGF